MGKVAFIYPGQGSQKAFMGKDFYEQCDMAKKVYDTANEVLDIDVKELCFTENELLDNTAYTQAALVTTCLAMTNVLLERGIKPDVTAGLSLGEYAAIAAAGGLNFADAIRLVRARGIYMEEAVPGGKGAMAAVLGMEVSKIEEILRDREAVSIANYNCPGQIVITGMKEAVEDAVEALKEVGAKRCVMLNVSGPFHSEFLEEAGQKMGEKLKEVKVTELQIPYVTNVTAEFVTDIGETKGLLVKQVSSPVKWIQSVEKMIEEGVDTFVEIGPGKTLAGFVKKINKNVKVLNVSTVEDIGEVVCYLEKQQ